jgi:hypothetical protein
MSKPLAVKLSTVSEPAMGGKSASGTWSALVLTILLSAGLLGCRSPLTTSAADSYYLNPNKNLRTIGRVALVEPNNESSYPQISTDVSEALFLALQKNQLFGLTPIKQDSPDWRNLQANLDSAYPLQQLSVMRQTLKCDAVLIGTITEYRPYPHLTVGLRLKLLDLTDGQLLWGIEQVWDSADKYTEKQIKSYHNSEMRSGLTSLHEELVAISSINFIKFVAYEVAQTLQPRKSNKITFSPKVP